MSPASQKKADEFQIFLQSMQDVLGVVVDEGTQHSVHDKLAPVLDSYGYDSLGALAEAMREEGSRDGQELSADGSRRR